MSFAALLLMFAAGVVKVDGSASCPSPAQVATRLRALLADVPAAGAPDQARIDAMRGQLRIELRSAAGILIGARRVDVVGSCADLAGVAAVVIAAWETELRSARLPLPRLPAPRAERAPPPAVSPSARAPLETARTPRSPAPVVRMSTT